MHGTTPARHRAADEPLVGVEERHPEWRPWLRLVRLALEELERGWDVQVDLIPERADGVPLLHDAVLTLDERRTRGWMERLIAAAADFRDGGNPLDRSALDRVPPLGLVGAAIRMDDEAIATMADSAGADANAFGSIAQLAVFPILHSVRRRLAREIPTAWPHGWCPVCAAWPTLAEMRGLERERRMRCGRCGSDWRRNVLHCPFCDENDHRKLGALLEEGDEERRRVETCRTCMGYLKSVTTLGALPEAKLAAEDVTTLHHDLVAVERGFRRPERAGFELALRVTAQR